jgi:5-methyltetrahydrofolate--homocysteine methyltransferase
MQATMTFSEALASGRTLLADGATGTMLQAAGLPVGEAPERWTRERPEAIRDLARQYAAAGSDIVYTNTFGGNRLRLERCGLADRLVELNQRAVALAREGIAAAKAQVWVVASVGPTGEVIEPYGELSRETARAAFAEQAKALAAARVDGVVCESFMDIEEALLCLEAVRAVVNVPVLVSMSFEQNGRTVMGVTPEETVTRLADAAGVGVNCSVGPDVVEKAVRAMRAARPTARLLAKPNAGLPQVAGGKTGYALKPDSMAAFALRMKALAAAVVGGCCGTTPDHIRAMRAALTQ